MKTSELIFDYPPELIAINKQQPSRVLSSQVLNPAEQNLAELSWSDFLSEFKAGDVLVVNDTKVLKRRVFSIDGQEILFLSQLSTGEKSIDSSILPIGSRGQEDKKNWTVLFPAKKLKIGDLINLPLGLTAELVQKGIPQTIKLSQSIDESYFDQVGELPIPPYIQKARNERHNTESENSSYQTWWGNKPGSLAAPTASLHFSTQDWQRLKENGVQILNITLHVGLGTFLPVTTENLEQHKMHAEWVEIPLLHWEKIQKAKSENRTIWALGTTVVRSLESQALGRFVLRDQAYSGTTDLMIRPGFQFQIVDKLLTNFHQPQSTLIALVMAFAGKDNVLKSYQWAIGKKFRLFSYGDLTYWSKATFGKN